MTQKNGSYSRQLAGHLARIQYGDINENAVDMAKMCIADLFGVTIAAGNTDVGDIWKRYYMRSVRGAETATVLDGSFRSADYRDAAPLNAALGHILELDDLHNSSIAHLGVVTIPAAIALGQKLKKSGKDVLAAIVCGYEAGARVGEAIVPGSYFTWHTTGIVGTFSSAVACAKLLGFDADAMLNCIGSAGTQSAGLWEFLNDGAMSKPLHTANAVCNGMRAAELTALGLTGATRIVEGERGLAHALTADCHVEALADGLSLSHYKIETNSFKPYACCRHTHAADSCVEKLMRENAIDPAHITHIEDRTYRVAKETVDIANPSTLYAYKFSVQYCIAALLLYGSLMSGMFSEARVNRPEVRALMDKITVSVDEELDAAYRADPTKWVHALEITMDDGRVLKALVEYPRGDFRNPFSWEDIKRKFNDVTADAPRAGSLDGLLDRIRHAEELSDVNLLFEP